MVCMSCYGKWLQTTIAQIENYMYPLDTVVVVVTCHHSMGNSFSSYASLPAVSVSVPYQLRSITDKQKLTVKVYNGRSEPLQWWWVNYDGNTVYYSTIQAGSEITQLTYGTHPWLITTMSGDVMGVYVSNTANAKISIE